jgi:hypothetical protein
MLQFRFSDTVLCVKDSTSDRSPCSETGGVARGAVLLEPLGEEEDSDGVSEAGASVDSLDEGLGDINCENEVRWRVGYSALSCCRSTD